MSIPSCVRGIGVGALVAAAIAAPDAAFAQANDHYSVTGGVLGAYNLSQVRVEDGVEEYEWANGWAAGLWLNFPFSDLISLEGQLQYSSIGYDEEGDQGTSLLADATVGYISLPFSVKLNLGSIFAVMAGSQLDFPVTVDDDRNVWETGDIASPQWALQAGLELFPYHRVSLFARYIHGLTNIDGTDNPNTQSEYYNRGVQAGVKVRFFGGRKAVDTDGDGIVDDADACPTVMGLARYDGCPVPDSDGDGIDDEADACPQEVGTAANDGCPVPDRDGDGIADAEDRCPTEPGVAAYDGCPVPDQDGDGVLDDEDRCPTVAGSAAMRGCPALDEFEPHRVTFATNSATLTAEGRAELDEVVAYLRTHPDVEIRLDGHTDNTGSDRINDPLSERRAASARDYIAAQGISVSRMSVMGHGSRQPVADNATAAGRAMNRRVEIVVR